MDDDIVIDIPLDNENRTLRMILEKQDVKNATEENLESIINNVGCINKGEIVWQV